ncbi:protein NRT1/ PTR FAMILY 8.3-like [Oryza glaberrima]|uniref:Major facilitator superfamily (MFS) profile domain-containing protein n=1 Tax=Oryza glaberrima TaxID=4538 RepID=I1QS71_ORYGL|nr:protein NRT1/ PTR FAMILY 8.3-like [Oryza glaberrima]
MAAAAAAGEDEEKRPLLLRPNGGGGWRACVLILGTELSDCLAFAGIARNLVSYLTGVVGESNVAAARDVSAWTGTCFLTPLVGAFIADSYLGRRTTILLFLSIYTMGMITLTVSASFATPHLDTSSDGVLRATVFLGLYLVALGVGGIKPCASPLGADQFDDDDAAPAARASFFNWYYFCINIGSLLAATVLVWVQERAGWWLGFAIPAAVMAAALAAFLFCSTLCGLRASQSPPGSPLTRLCQVVVAAFRNRGVELPGDSSLLHQLPDGDHRIIEHTDQFAFLDKAAVVASSPAVAMASPWMLCTVTQVEEVKMLLRLSAVWPTVVFFFAATAQMSSTFVEQGKAMDTRVGPLDVPPATLSTFEVVSILLCVPAYDAVLMPLARRVTGDRRGLSQLQRLGVGLALSALAMAYSALLEASRRRRRAATSIVWQAPSYMALGAAEVFTSVGLLEFFYDQAPDTMKSLCTAVSLVAVAAGSYLNSAIVAVVAWATAPEKGGGGWIPDDLNHGRLDCFFWLMFGLSCVNLLAFVYSSTRYSYKVAN